MDLVQINPELVTSFTVTQDDEVQIFVNMINSMYKPVQLEGVIGIRKLLSANHDPPIQKVIDTGVVPKLLEFMTWEDQSKFQHESAWSITNICSGESKFVDYIIQLGGLDIIINLVDSHFDDVVDQAIWAIGNITGDSTVYRDICLNKGCMKKLIQILDKFAHSDSIVKNTIWTISNLTRGKPFPDWEKVRPALPVLHKQISEVYSQDVLSDSLWSLSYISDVKIQEVINQGFVPFLVHHLFDTNNNILVPSLRSLGNLVTGNDAQTNEVLSFPEFLPKIFELTQHIKRSIQKEACWTLSNITAGNPMQIEMILESTNYMQKFKTLVTSSHKDVATEACWAIGNMISGATSEQIDRIVKDHGFVQLLPRLLTNHKSQVKQRGLEAILAILKAGGTTSENDYTQYIEDTDILDLIDGLIENPTLTAKAELILTYFETEEDEENENYQKIDLNNENSNSDQPQQKNEDQTSIQNFEKED